MTIKHKIGSVVAAGMIYAALATPALAATNVHVTNNGSLSKNVVVVAKKNSNTTLQTNVTKVKNNVGTTQNTGKNSASFNNGGNSTVTSGGATSTVAIVNTGGGNTATNNCGCPEGDTEVHVTHNGAGSVNGAVVLEKNSSFTSQSNNTKFTNNVWTTQNTGKNSASFNTGGTSDVESGPAKSTVGIENNGGGNTLN